VTAGAARVIDLHCHVVPGVDDGPATMEESLALCRAAVEAGTTRIIATPHVNWRYPDNDAGAVRRGVATVNAALREASIDLDVDAGAEIALSRIEDLSEREIALLRLGEGPYSLIECPHQGGAPAAIEEMLHRFAASGHSIVLAHPERCPVFQSNPRLLAGLIQAGILCCITARALTGDFGSRAGRYAWDLMEAGHVHAIASDAHDAHRRPPDLAVALDRAGLSESQIEYFASSAPEAIINGTPLSRAPHVGRPRSRRWPLGRRPR
jgi:protein-tyrosine phosphatase